MDEYGRYVIQYGSVLILHLAGAIGITAVILVRITVNNDLGSHILLFCNCRSGLYRSARYCSGLCL